MIWVLVFTVFFQLPFTGKLTPELKAQLAAADPDEKIEVIVHMAERYPYENLDNLSYSEKVRVFRNIAYTSQQSLIEYLNLYSEKVTDLRQFWIFNGLHAKATKKIIEAIAQRNDVWFITHNAKIEIPPMDKGEEMPTRTVEWNIQKVMADSCWAFGYTGDNVIIGHLDTGIDTTHEALSGGKLIKWHDFVFHNPMPYDDHGHGTHTAGLICGGDAFGQFNFDIGVAPGVKIIEAKALHSMGIPCPVDTALQWMAELKADSGYNIRAISNSWGGIMGLSLWEECQTLKALEILLIFAIGNSGPNPSTTASPGNYPLVLGIGAVNASDSMANFSSRGPAPDSSPWNDPQYWFRPDWNRTKPDLVAPGVNIQSAYPGNQYRIFMGTNMAAPHVAGAIAILCQANPNLTIIELYNILLNNADEPPQGAPYPNNNYGWGRLNVWRALQAVIGVEEQKKKEVKNNIVLPTIVRGPLYLPSNRKLTVFDISGREVAPPYLAPGVYFVELDKKIIRKVVIVK